MKKFLPRLLICLSFLSFSIQEIPQQIRIPLEKATGTGPFSQIFFNLHPRSLDDAMDTLYERATNLPAEYKGLQVGIYLTNYPQMVYYGYKHKFIDSTTSYSILTAVNNSLSDWKYYTDRYVDGQISIAFGNNAQNQKVVIIDANNNESFQDDKIHVFSTKDSVELQKFEQNYPHAPIFSAQYEYFDGTSIQQAVLDLIIYPFNKDRFMIASREHRKGIVKLAGKQYSFSVGNNFLGTFYDKRRLSVVTQEGQFKSYPKPVDASLYRGLNDIITLGDQAYKISNVTPVGDALFLEKQSKDAVLTGLYKGAVPPDIDTVTLSGKPVTFKKGKFTLIDFWGTWCMPCREELPYLKDVFNFFPPNEFEMVGIALDQEKRLRPFLKQHQIGWEQIVVSSTSRLIREYNINTYPSTFLIDPGGKVIALQEELRKNQLIKTLIKYLDYSEKDFIEWVKEGNNLITLPDKNYQVITIKGEFTNNQALPLYQLEGKWQRGLSLKPGEYPYVIYGYSKGEGSFSKKGIISIAEKKEQMQTLIKIEI